MKLCTFEVGGRRSIGVEAAGQMIDLPVAHVAMVAARGLKPCAPKALPADMLAFLHLGATGVEAARDALAFMAKRPALPVGERASYLLDEVKLLAPISRPGKILCSGLNYRSHVEENPNAKFLEDPRFFAKTPNTVIGPGEPIRHPGLKYQVDYEVELAVVIGLAMPRATPAERVMDHVFGYTILHDVSSRYIQFKDNNEVMGKSFDTFCPIGPCLVTADEIPDPSKLRLRTLLNGQVMQDGTNADWCFPLPRLLAWLSQAMTLEPGDLVSTGTPAGIGWFRKPQAFLKPGDLVRLEISGIGALENPVVAGKRGTGGEDCGSSMV
jgi:2-keto-4-pentenoate hydratase/2-oxohepta-3-ene-1,7-dioic acid hydratase in catechol pathway